MNLFWSLLGRTTYEGSRWAILLMIVKLGTAEQLGCYSLALAVSTPIFALTNLQLAPAYVCDANDDYRYNTYLRVRLVSVQIAVAISVAAVWLMGYSGQAILTTGATTLLLGIYWISNILLATSHKSENLIHLGKSEALKGVLGIGIVVSVFLLSDNLALALFAASASWATVLVLYDYPAAAAQLAIHGAADHRQHYRLVWSTLPFALGAFALALAMRLPEYCLVTNGGLVALGALSVILSVLQFERIVNVSLIAPYLPRLSQTYPGQTHIFWRTIRRLLMALVALNGLTVLVVLCFGHELLNYVFNPAIGRLYWEFLLACTAGILSAVATVFAQALIAIRRYRSLFVVHGILLAASVVMAHTLTIEHVVDAVVFVFVIVALRVMLCGTALFLHTSQARTQLPVWVKRPAKAA